MHTPHSLMHEYIEELEKAAPRLDKRYESTDGVVFMTLANSDLSESCICYTLPEEKDPGVVSKVIPKSKLLSIVGANKLRAIFEADFDRIFKES